MSVLEVPGARLSYQVRGSGPVLLLIPGGPADGSNFDSVAPLLAENHTVLTYDPRGLSASTADDPTADITVEIQADDAHRLLDAVTDEPAYVFGSSGGAITGLVLATAHPEQVATLVAHEPPIIELLPDREERRAHNEDVYRTARTLGIGAAMGKFMAGAGFDIPDDDADDDSDDDDGEPDAESLAALARMQANLEVFFGPMWRALGDYTPDLAALRATPSRVVIGVGSTSPGQLAYRTGMRLAEQLGQEPSVFPGDHLGMLTRQAEFAARLVTVLGATG
ncbi:MAG TPA: alpha/beta hydrolase [Pseudonocardiaceae bacterium]|jgi:pimeloyl-ACP methyl ester carboxylesterase|nr:alpha/beta hydrolase [Pseudonocardiaceae bacterium]